MQGYRNEWRSGLAIQDLLQLLPMQVMTGLGQLLPGCFCIGSEVVVFKELGCGGSLSWMELECGLQEIQEEGICIGQDHLESCGFLAVIELKVIGQVGCLGPQILLNEAGITGHPMTEKTSSSWCMSVVPGKRVCPSSTSATVHPILHISMDQLQALLPQMIQGARQWRVVTLPVLSTCYSVDSGGATWLMGVAMLKSPSFSVPSGMMYMLSGFISLCMKPSACMWATAVVSCCTRHLTCSLDSSTSLWRANYSSSMPKSMTMQWLSQKPLSCCTRPCRLSRLGCDRCPIIDTYGYSSTLVITGEVYFFRGYAFSFFTAKYSLLLSFPSGGWDWVFWLMVLLFSQLGVGMRCARQTLPKEPSPRRVSLLKREWKGGYC